jgi:uncharacterized membrane protein YGL010W
MVVDKENVSSEKLCITLIIVSQSLFCILQRPKVRLSQPRVKIRAKVDLFF